MLFGNKNGKAYFCLVTYADMPFISMYFNKFVCVVLSWFILFSILWTFDEYQSYICFDGVINR